MDRCPKCNKELQERLIIRSNNKIQCDHCNSSIYLTPADNDQFQNNDVDQIEAPYSVYKYIFELNRAVSILFIGLSTFFVITYMLPALLNTGFHTIVNPVKSIDWLTRSFVNGLFPLVVIIFTIVVFLQLLADIIIYPNKYVTISKTTIYVPYLWAFIKKNTVIKLADIIGLYIVKLPASNVIFQTKYLIIKTSKRKYYLSEANLRDKRDLDRIKNILETKIKSIQINMY
jgi:hypothetical protein